jgi:DNA repair protein RecO (recombination protein O)
VASPTRSSDSVRVTRALLLKRVEYGEADLVLTLFTETLGRVSALARGARRSQKRFGGALEPIHTLELELDERPKSELYGLRAAKLATARMTLTRDLDRLNVAGRALSWIRRAAPVRTPEPALWSGIHALLDRLDDRDETRPPSLLLAGAGLELTQALGFGLDFERCVRCGKACPEGQPALLDAARGGLVCRACGGGRLRLESGLRKRLALTASGATPFGLEVDDGATAIGIVEAVLRAHAGFEE